jgi:hypothetical protein
VQRSEILHADLDRARAERDALVASGDLHVAAEHWRGLLHRLDRFWNRFNAHFGRSPLWNGWSSQYKKEMKADPLLQYMSKARDADHHTIDQIVAVEGGRIDVGQGGRVILKHTAPNTMALIHASGHVVFEPSRLTLKAATTRGVTYDVPLDHLGKPIDPNNVPLIAGLAIDYFAALLARAEAELCH